jgi:hypothetical protein
VVAPRKVDAAPRLQCRNDGFHRPLSNGRIDAAFSPSPTR